MTIEDLVARLHADAVPEERAEEFAAIEAVLSEFQRLGLAELELP